MKPLRLYLPAVLITALSACSNPAEPASAPIGGAALNGVGLGSGHRGDSTTTQTTSQTQSGGGFTFGSGHRSETTTTSSDTTGRGGIMLGSGH